MNLEVLVILPFMGQKKETFIMTSKKRVKVLSLFDIERKKLRVGMNKTRTCEEQFSRILASSDLIVCGTLWKFEQRKL